MNMTTKTLFSFLLLLAFTTLNGQSRDSVRSLNAEDILFLVRHYHPIARQSDISIRKANADILIARGAFDPVFKYTSTDKTFSGTNYYHYTSPELRLPTWYGVEVFGGLENLYGDRTNPTQTLGKTNYVGISVPLMKNLVMDKRRAFLQQAEIFITMAAVQQRSIINDLSIDAMEAYWAWVKSYQNYLVVKTNVEVNEKRMDMMVRSWKNGERSGIDTIEAFTQLQTFQFQEQANWLEFRNAGLQLSAYLWKQDGSPYQLPENVIPGDQWESETVMDSFNIDLNKLLTVAQKNHPDLNVYDYKLDNLQLEKKLKFQELLPRVDLSYKHLAKGHNVTEYPPNSVFRNDYQYNLTVEIPLRLSQGRGEFEKTKLRIEETTLDYEQKKLDVALKIKAYYNTFLTLQTQIELQEQQYRNLQLLVNAEETRFRSGESSLFLINSRETKALEARQKLIDLKTQYFKTLYAMQWSAGLLQ
jgi:outer membrane protein TolC